MTLRLIGGEQAPPITLPLFDSVLDRTGRRQLEGLITLAEVGSGQELAREGEVGREYLVLSDGMVKLWKGLPDGRRQIVAFRGPGDLVNLHRRHTPWPATAQTVSASRLYRIDWEGLTRLAARYPVIDQALFDLACDEVTILQNRILMLGRMTIEEKLASFILEFCRPPASPSSLSREVNLPMRRPDIAEYLGLTTESVSREFSRFRQERFIDMPRPSRLIVLNRPALETIAFGADGLEQRNGWSSPQESPQAGA